MEEQRQGENSIFMAHSCVHNGMRSPKVNLVRGTDLGDESELRMPIILAKFMQSLCKLARKSFTCKPKTVRLAITLAQLPDVSFA